MKSSDDLILEAACTIADAVARTFGPNCEVATHDLRKPTHSLIHLANGHVTGRQLGSPIRDLIYKVLPEMNPHEGGLFNYRTVLDDGRQLKSTTCLLRNADGEPLVAFCVNLDITDLSRAGALLTQLSHVDDSAAATEERLESGEGMRDEVADILRHLVINVVRPAGRSPDTLSKRERLVIIDFLDRKGAFRIRGAVQLVAQEMGISEPTAYRYIYEVRRQGDRAGTDSPASAATLSGLAHDLISTAS
jgi:predicted transcriptional regulator YheO